MGDGINDAAAMKASDVGISVDSAVDIAKESADVIFLEKDLMVLEEGIIEGRKTYGNMMMTLTFTGFGKSIGLLPLPPVYFAWLALTIFLYMALATCLKKAFIRHYGELL
ncbi:magnesium-transporting ATPase [Fibrobacteria bacterium R8-3-H12]